ncbi:fibrinogen gamma chain [Heterodontus francisci]|uniref:fibrinogen gamma chain n=1 Tax=Heterodontus francisci TaxID=7792 RepID=UPI00355C061A
MSGAREKISPFLHVLLLVFLSVKAVSMKEKCCILDEDFGEFCPTTCGVGTFFQSYQTKIDGQLGNIEDDLNVIQNQSTVAQNKIDTIEQSNTIIRKQLPDALKKHLQNIHTESVSFERIMTENAREITELENLITTNNEKINHLKSLTQKLQDRCDTPCQDTVQINEITGQDCQSIADKGVTRSGLYYIKLLKGKQKFLVYCEIEPNGRGWTVLQRRLDGSVDFNRHWVEYKEGFGYLSPGGYTEFWLGNEKIHLITTQHSGPYLLQITLKDWSGHHRYAEYMDFKVGSEEDKYRLRYSFYNAGDAGDAFDGFDFGDDPSDKFYTAHNGMQFSTPDADHDRYNEGSCAEQDRSGWWMNRCHAGNLNGRYHQGGVYTAQQTASGFDDGIIWTTWHNRWYSLKETTMKIIPYKRYMTLQRTRQTEQSQAERGDY